MAPEPGPRCATYEMVEVDSARSAGTPPRAPQVVSELAVFRAVLAKNWALKWRGFICCCSGASPFCARARLKELSLLTLARAARRIAVLEIAVPLIFLALLCLPRYLISDQAHPARFYAPANITDLAWSMVRRDACSALMLCA